MPAGAVLRIGELSKRSGVSPELLRAWERRYGLLRPTRSPGGLRLYSPADLERVRLMQRHLADGVAAAEAATLALEAETSEDDAELLMWVLFTLVDSATVVYRTYVRDMSREEESALWRDYRVVGRLFGLSGGDMPRTLADLDDYRRSMLEGDR